MTVRPAKGVYKSVAVGGRLERERCEIEPGRPSLRPQQQGVDVFGCEVEPETSVQESVGFVGGESQIGGS